MAQVQAYEAGMAQVKAYEAGMAQVKEYETGKATLDAAAKQLAAGKAKLDAGATQLAAGKTKLDEAAAQLVAGKTALDDAAAQLKVGKAQLAEFEAGETQVLAGYATLKENPSIKEKIDDGMTPLAAAKEVMDEETVKTTNELTSRAYLYIALIVVAVIGIVAAIMGVGLENSPTANKVKGSVILGVIALIIAVVANIYGAMNGYTAFPLQMVAVILEAVFALLFVVSIFNYKNAGSIKTVK